MSKHTPGPWVAYGTYVHEEDGSRIAYMANRDEQALVDARLIAAAPEMLALVKQVAALSRHDICTPDVAQANNFAHVLLKRIEGSV